MKTIVIGMGEIGTAVATVLRDYYDVHTYDKKDSESDALGFTKVKSKGGTRYDVMHICFPYSEDFVRSVRKYQRRYNPKYTVIHSTVKPGTSKKLGACHSPVMGNHPYLEQSIRTFEKFVAGDGADVIADYFRRAGLRPVVLRDPTASEVGKIFMTNYYAVCIEFTKEAERICNEYGISFQEAFTLFQRVYNDGYDKLGYREYMRPLLQPLQKKQGGHCTLNNLALLESDFAKLVKKLNRVCR